MDKEALSGIDLAASMRTGAFRNPFLTRRGRPTGQITAAFLKWLLNQPDVIQAGRLLWRDRRPGTQTPEYALIETLASDTLPEPPQWPVFVFGSNLAGRHGAGAAEYAARLYQAVTGIGRGRTGHAYALPTKDEQLNPRPIAAVLEEIDALAEYARTNPDIRLRLTRVGCGLAGLDEAAIREHAVATLPDQVELPGLWRPAEALPRVIVAGSRPFKDQERLARALDQVRDKLGQFEVVSGGAAGADTLGEDYAIAHTLPLRRFPAYWDQLDRSAGRFRNQVMAWYATHLVAFHQNNSPGTGHMIKTARAAGLTVAAISCP
jgi:hypothetical protein